MLGDPLAQGRGFEIRQQAGQGFGRQAVRQVLVRAAGGIGGHAVPYRQCRADGGTRGPVYSPAIPAGLVDCARSVAANAAYQAGVSSSGTGVSGPARP